MSTEQIECLEPVKGMQVQIPTKPGMFPILRLYLEKDKSSDLYNFILEIIKIEKGAYKRPIFYKCILLKNMKKEELQELYSKLRDLINDILYIKRVDIKKFNYEIISVLKKELDLKSDEEVGLFMEFVFKEILLKNMKKYTINRVVSLLGIIQLPEKIDIFNFNLKLLKKEFSKYLEQKNHRKIIEKFILNILINELRIAHKNIITTEN